MNILEFLKNNTPDNKRTEQFVHKRFSEQAGEDEVTGLPVVHRVDGNAPLAAEGANAPVLLPVRCGRHGESYVLQIFGLEGAAQQGQAGDACQLRQNFRGGDGQPGTVGQQHLRLPQGHRAAANDEDRQVLDIRKKGKIGH